MGKKYLKKIIAQSPEDLQLISACCSEANVKMEEIKYLRENKIFLLYLERFNREGENSTKKIYSVIKFEYIGSSKSKNINQNDKDLVMELLAIDLFKRNDNYEITLLFSKNRFITLTAEIIEVTLEDQKTKNDKSN